MQHLDEGTIHAWLDGALDANESSRIDKHVAECETCSVAVAEARGLIAGASRIVSSLDVVPGNVIPRSSGKASSRGWLWRSLHLTPGRAALAATLLLAVGTMLTVQHSPTSKAALPTPLTAPSAVAAATRLDTIREPSVPPPPAAVASAQNKATSPAPTAVVDAKKSIATETAPAPVTDSTPTRMAVAPAAALASSGAVTTSSITAHALDSLKADTLRQRRPQGLDSARMTALAGARAFAASRGAGGGGVARGGLADAAFRTNDITECYRVNSDSASVGLTGAFLPRQFMLAQNVGPPSQNVIRAVAPDGRIDSAVAGTRWERLTPTITRLYLTRTVGESPSTLTLFFADGRVVAGQLSTAAGVRNIDISRSNCRP